MMCGIAGIIGEVHDKTTLNRMVSIMRHRGPDASGFFSFGAVQFGHCRLSINDLSQEANQPFVSEDKNLSVIVNGEVYNFKELRADLENQGFHFRSKSDSEVLLHGYAHYGTNIIEKINGMFAVAIYDIKANKVFLARDRLGIKPLYYHHGNKRFVFGSEIKAIAQCVEVDLQTDFQALNEYLVFENCFSNRTLNYNIKSVLPGEIVSIDVSTLSLARDSFWLPKFNYSLSPSGGTYKEYLSTVEKAVTRHLLSDVPVGAYLSSGVDSSTVTYWAAKILKGRELKTYTGSFGMKGFYDEWVPAKKIATAFQCQSMNVSISPEDFIENIEDVLWHLDEPKVGMGSFSQYMVAKTAAKDVKVILTGHGGDELFAGYPIFKVLYGQNQLMNLFRHSTSRELMFAIYFLVGPYFKKGIKYFLPEVNSPNNIRAMVHPDVLKELEIQNPYGALEKLKRTTENSYEFLTLNYLKHYLPALFSVEDKISMAHSLESRTPLCDNEILDLALSVPLWKKLQSFEPKHIPKVAMRGKLPPLVYNIPKKGFPTPLLFWFKHELQNFMREFILDNLEFARFFKREQVENLIRSHCRKKINTPFLEISAHKLWMIINLILYFKNQKYRYLR